ncbi:MAG: hypothetical protein FJX19_07775 [Alphaproteobacteria bacterium]|nr:hypothetical protein [Alphaproteobacteria bacterium]
MTAWRARLAAIRAEHPNADSADSADSPPATGTSRPIGTNGTNGNGMEAPETPGGVPALQAANDAVDPDALAEREAIQAEQWGEFGPPVPPEEHARHIAGLVKAPRPSLLWTLQENERLRPAGYYEQLEEMFRPQPARLGTNRCPSR